MTYYTYGPWTVHTPGECPVPPDALVQVQLRNQSQIVAEECAPWPENDWDWSEDGEEAIAYYRIARKAVTHDPHEGAGACEFSGMVRQVSSWWLIPAVILGAALWVRIIGGWL